MTLVDHDLDWLDDQQGLVPLLGRLSHVERSEDAVVLHADPPFTEADWARLPADGPRYELWDGTIVVTPSPVPDHGRHGWNVSVLLRQGAAQVDLEVFDDIDLQMTDGRILRPDHTVLPATSVGAERLHLPVVLVAEVISKGSRQNDRVRKRNHYAESGIPHYWIIDRLAKGGTTVEALRLDGSSYVTERLVGHDDSWTSTLPFVVTVTPSQLGAR